MDRSLRPERLLFASLGAMFCLLFAAALLGSCMLDRFDSMIFCGPVVLFIILCLPVF